jgi:predicted amidohydrolase YtcJ
MYIVGGKIITMTGTDYFQGVIHIKEGKIVAVGTEAEVPICPQENETVLEVRDGFIMPGMIEAHCHMGITEEK